MPIKVPDNLPAMADLEDEGVLLITEGAALHQDVRPLEIALLNLMPQKIKTETQISRLLGATPLQIDLTLVTTSNQRRTSSVWPTTSPRVIRHPETTTMVLLNSATNKPTCLLCDCWKTISSTREILSV